MADEVKIDYGEFRIAERWTRKIEPTAEQKARFEYVYERTLERMHEMPLYKNLPTGGFNYKGGWFFKTHEQGFLNPADPRQTYKVINDHVKHLSPEEMDIFCSQVFEKATELLDPYGLSSASPVRLWEMVAQELGIPIRKGTIDGVVFCAWAMKLVGSRIAWGMKNTPEKLQVLTKPGNSGYFNMHGKPDKNVPDAQPLNYTAPSVDKFIAKGVLKFGGQPDKMKAILRFHTHINPSKPGPVNASNKDSSAVKVAPGSRLQDSSRPVNVATESESTIRLRRSQFGSHVGVRAPAWWGSMNRPEGSKEISRSPVIPSEPQNHEATAQGSKDQVGAVDALVIGMHGTTMEDGGKGPGVFANLAIRTVNPLKRRHDDTEESGATGLGGKPPAKMAKVSQVQANTSGSPSQLDEP